jgi:5-(carboxyamino)imidazole ribonucleotide synthase
VVIKTSRFGYDGKGQKIISQKEEIDKVASQFNNVPVIIEEMIDFELEMSVIICRDMDGKISAYDPSENVHQNGILIESKVPANISLSIASDAIIIASKIIRNLEYIGTMGIEFFLTKSKQLLVNEMAPRVHNSGHWTQSGCIISQFEQHIRAITGNSIGDGKRHSNIMMKNILGEDIYNIRYDSESSLNIYGKDEAKLNRKMGHSNIIK